MRHEPPAANAAQQNAVTIDDGTHRKIDLAHHTPTIAPTRTPWIAVIRPPLEPWSPFSR